MNHRSKKTEHLLLLPTENGWQAVHKKYKTPYGNVTCNAVQDGVQLQTQFGENTAQEAEAVPVCVDLLFQDNPVETVWAMGEPYTRAAWQAQRHARFAACSKTADDYAAVLGKPVHCVMDRPLGSVHPRYPDMRYTVNYGYVPGVLAGDQSEQDVYVLGPKTPLHTFDGVVVAVIHRFDDVEDKWVVAEKQGLYTAEEILQQVWFQEQYYESQILL